MSVDFEAVKARQRQVWSTGNYSDIAGVLTLLSENLCESVELRAGQRVLDVACGNGNTSIAAARRRCDVTAIDYVPEMLDRARQRADVEGLRIDFQVADAEQLPFPDASFDVVLSTIGVMFAPNQTKAAAELLRVCRPGGRIGLANWTPDGYVGDALRVAARFVPPPAGLPSPLLWGTDEGLRALIGTGVSSMRTQRRTIRQYFLSPEHQVEVYRASFGPTQRAFQSLDDAGQAALEAELTATNQRSNVSGDETLVVPCDYLEVVATRS